MIKGTIDRLKLREFDRQVGALFGLAKGLLYCTLLTLFAVTLMGDRVRETIVRSKSGHYIANVLDRSQAVIPPEIHEVVRPYLDRFDQRFNGSSEDGILDQVPWLAEGQSGEPSWPAFGRLILGSKSRSTGDEFATARSTLASGFHSRLSNQRGTAFSDRI